MTQDRRPEFLKLVHSSNARDAKSGSAPQSAGTGQAQDTFLPSNDPATLIFFSWDKASADDLLDIFQLSRPKVIFDLRVAPRFDLGPLTRRRFFELLRQHNCQYIDLFGRIGISNINDALVNPLLVALRVAQFTEALTTPNSGPFVFFYDGDLLDDEYVGAFAKSLPSGTGAQWKVYRPLDRKELLEAKAGVSHDASISTTGAAPLLRRVVFISHATPNDNAFVMWLTSKLTAAGYQVWSDLTDLKGGDVFWGNIEEVIRQHAAKVLFVHSANVKEKTGTRKEVYLALKIGERNRLQRFVVPLRIDETPFEETLIELIDIHTIDCRQDWLAGLRTLLALLQRDGVPRTISFKADQFSELILKFSQPKFALIRSPESLVSNWLPIVSLPEEVNFFSCGGLSSNQLPSVAAQLPVPAFAFYTHIVTTAARDQFSDALLKIGRNDVHVAERASIAWSDFITARHGDLPSWTRKEARIHAFNLFHKAWNAFADDQHTLCASLSNKKTFRYFAHKQFDNDEVRFSNYSGRVVRRQLVGYSAKRRVFWHFGVQARAASDGERFYIVLTPHVTFSNDGKVPLVSSAQLHSLRRSFCRSWWNDRWRDLLQAFVAAMAAGNDVLRLDIGTESPMEIATAFRQFSCPVTVADVGASIAAEIKDDDDVDDEWEDLDYDELGVGQFGDEDQNETSPNE